MNKVIYIYIRHKDLIGDKIVHNFKTKIYKPLIKTIL
jgi:hypothetical protein